MTKPIEKPRVFISYAHADRGFAKRIAETLRRDGLSFWFAEWDLSPGDSISERIHEALSASDYLVMLLSPDRERHTCVPSLEAFFGETVSLFGINPQATLST